MHINNSDVCMIPVGGAGLVPNFLTVFEDVQNFKIMRYLGGFEPPQIRHHSIFVACRCVTPTTPVRFPYVTPSADLSLRQHGFDSRMSLHLPICHSDNMGSIPVCHSICRSVTPIPWIRFPTVTPSAALSL